MTTIEVKTEMDQNEGSDSRSQSPGMDIPPEQEGFFNLLSHVQGARIDEQRCNIQIVHNKGGSTGLEEHSPDSPPPEMNKLMDMLAHSQSRRLDDQRADFTYVPGCPNTENNGTATSKEKDEFSPPAPFPDIPIAPGEDYFTLIHRVHSRHFQKPSP
ncbi:Purkinje cell protein 2 homolog isoform X2 [Pleurodeles waltl]|uniref:Purkinje cell protein 2 homolog isoform X2 n=1 Tax=Pleurodeles waltl TaxID=8319 RepID=UPI003709BC54